MTRLVWAVILTFATWVHLKRYVECLQQLHKSVRVTHQRVDRLKAQYRKERGCSWSHEDLSIMEENSPEKYPADLFACIFWEQQLKASPIKNAYSMKWDDSMLHHLSSSAYETLCFPVPQISSLIKQNRRNTPSVMCQRPPRSNTFTQSPIHHKTLIHVLEIHTK